MSFEMNLRSPIRKTFFLKSFLGSFFLASFFLISLGCNGAGYVSIDGSGSSGGNSADIFASSGGMVKLQGEVSLNVPANSLSADTTISVEKVDNLPAGESDGFQSFGQGYRFSPPGTKFSLDKPATLTIKYDSNAMSAKGLDPSTTQVYYFDEEQRRYINVASSVNTSTGEVTAQVEHFTVYVPLAKTMIPGNNAPVAALQNPVPFPIRAEAPIYIRALARDYDLGGAVAGVTLYYRKPAVGTWQSAQMSPETGTNQVDIYGFHVPSTFLTAADLGAGNDIEYYIVVTDNLGAQTTSAIQSINVTRIYQAGSLSIAPGVLSISAGFTRNFTARGVDNFGNAFILVPETVGVTNSIGTVVAPKSDTIISFTATKTAIGAVQAGFGAESANASITVYNGSLDHINILDNTLNPLAGVLDIKEGKVYMFDALGYDAYGNMISVLPTWLSDPILGKPIDSVNGVLYTLDGNGYGLVSANLGMYAAQTWINVTPRTWYNGGYLNQLFSGTGVTHAQWPDIVQEGNGHYTAYSQVNPATGTWSVYVRSWNTNNPPIGLSTVYSGGYHAYWPKIAVAGGQAFAAFYLNIAGSYRVYAAKFNGTGWTLYGINHNTAVKAVHPAIAMHGTTPYVVWSEDGQSYVKHFNGTTWVQDGGPIPFAEGFQKIYSDGTDIYVVGVEPDASSINQMIVRKWDGVNWVQVGGSLNVNPAMHVRMQSLDIAGYQGSLIVAFSEADAAGARQIYVKQWDGANWNLLGGSLSVDGTGDAYSTNLSVYKDDAPLAQFGYSIETPYITWSEQNASNIYTVHVKHWDGTSWVSNGPGLNINAASHAYAPGLAHSPNYLFVIWQENDPASGLWYVRQKYLY